MSELATSEWCRNHPDWCRVASPEFLDDLDPGIRDIVRVLYEHGVETYESCEGTAGHCYPEPTVRFHGEQSAGYRAVALALTYGMRPTNLRRFWSVERNELHGPYWEMTFLIGDA